jgi:2-polyprenyl-3-methyl-5-hydroxy-6-metoxy-1,4-benzoquinol methylase
MDPSPSTNARLDEIAAGYDPSDPSQHFDYHLKRLQVRAMSRLLSGDRVLELGCATGELTSLLAPLAKTYDVVEGSATNVEIARARVPGARFVLSMWEDYEPAERYSDVVMCNALEHVEQPVALLERVRGWLEPGGRAHVVVPNAYSFHRLVGVEMGFQPDPVTLTAGDTAQGHARNYTPDALLADLRTGGFDVVHSEGIFLKVLANRQMLDWDPSLIAALDRVAKRVPEHAAELYAVAVPRG